MSRDRVAEAIAGFPVLDWLSRHVKVYDKGMVNTYTDCPICGGERKLGVNVDTKLMRCLKCDEGAYCSDIWNGKANLYKMIRLVERCSPKEAIEMILRMAGMPEQRHINTVSERPLPTEILPEGIVSLKGLLQHPSYVYLKVRGVEHLADKCFVDPIGKYKGRIVFETKWFGEPHGFEAKSYTNQKPKSLFPEWMDTENFLYSTEDWNPDVPVCVITESVIDAETFACNTVGMYGSVMREGQWLLLREMCRKRGITRLVWFLDNDAWYKQSKTLVTKALGMFDNYVVNVPKGQDPNSLGRDRAWSLAQSAKRIQDEFDLVTAAYDFGHL